MAETRTHVVEWWRRGTEHSPRLGPLHSHPDLLPASVPPLSAHPKAPQRKRRQLAQSEGRRKRGGGVGTYRGADFRGGEKIRGASVRAGETEVTSAKLRPSRAPGAEPHPTPAGTPSRWGPCGRTGCTWPAREAGGHPRGGGALPWGRGPAVGAGIGAGPCRGARPCRGGGAGGGALPWRRRLRRRRAALRRLVRQAARMLTRTATPRKQTPPTTPARTGWGRRPGSCVREGYTSRPGRRVTRGGRCPRRWAQSPLSPPRPALRPPAGFSPEVDTLAVLLGSLT